MLTRSASITTPNAGSSIEVLWVVDFVPGSPLEWWPATVIELKLQSATNILATGRILYDERHDFPSTIHEVNFHEKFLLSVRTDDDLNENFDRDIPLLQWRFKIPCEARDIDPDWTTKELIASEKKDYMNVLCTKVEALTAQIQKYESEISKIKNDVLMNTSNIARHISFSSELDEFVSVVGMKMFHSVSKAGLRPQRVSSESVSLGSVSRSSIQVRYECSWKQFQFLVRKSVTICEGDCSSNMAFTPALSDILSPSGSSESVSITFLSFLHIARIFGLADPKCLHAMLFHKVAERNANPEMIRVLGAYVAEDSQDASPCALVVGQSYVSDYIPSITIDDDDREDLVSRCTMAFTRVSRLQNIEDGEYSYPLVPEYIETSFVPRLLGCSKNLKHKAFSITWTMLQTPRRGQFSNVIRNNSRVGVMVVSMPCFQIEGSRAVSEFQKLLSDTVLKALRAAPSDP